MVLVLGVSKGYKWEFMGSESGEGICPCFRWKMGNYVKDICNWKSISKLISDDVVTLWRRFPIRNKRKKNFWIEFFSTECRKTKTKVNTTANLKKENNFKSPREFIVKATTLPKARENAGDLVVTGFVSADFLRRWREFFETKAEVIYSHTTVDTQLKIAIAEWAKVFWTN